MADRPSQPIAPEILAARVIAQRALDRLAQELAARRPAFAEVLRANLQHPPGQGRASLLGGIRPVERIVSFNNVEGRIETPVPGGQLPIVQLLVGAQPLSLGVVARTDADDDAEPDAGAAVTDDLRWAPPAAIEGRTATSTHAPIPLTQRVDPHVFPLIDVVLQIGDAGMQEVGG
ncbi:hypothetical protein SE17_17150 [Kouleothrix aurantiaca]|uniref:Uncharacterized protein n=1 Tax=Kouleothrix aurantiaca TaxID=186479 RepID=A0A0P9DFX4_9CHLR|nr:hypothetical protein SE17_17150 [Kouleothrix aurantiaca]